MTTTKYCYTSSAIVPFISPTSSFRSWNTLVCNAYIPSGTVAIIKFYHGNTTNASIADDTATSLYTYMFSELSSETSTSIDLRAQSTLKKIESMKYKVTLTHMSGANMPYVEDIVLTYFSSPWNVVSKMSDDYVSNAFCYVDVLMGKMMIYGPKTNTSDYRTYRDVDITVHFLYPMEWSKEDDNDAETNDVEAIIDAKIDALEQYVLENELRTYGYSYWSIGDRSSIDMIQGMNCLTKNVTFTSNYETQYD